MNQKLLAGDDVLKLIRTPITYLEVSCLCEGRGINYPIDNVCGVFLLNRALLTATGEGNLKASQLFPDFPLMPVQARSRQLAPI